MKKVLILNTSLAGHRKVYSQTIINILDEIDDIEEIIYVGEKIDIQTQIIKQSYHLTYYDYYKLKHISWLKKVLNIIKIENPDFIFVIDLDSLFLSLPIIMLFNKKIKMIGIVHHYPNNTHKGKIKEFIYKFSLKKLSLLLCHGNYIKNKFEKIGLKNSRTIYYPSFHSQSNISKEKARSILKIPSNKLMLLAFGSTRYDKGLDLLLKSCKKLKSARYILYIAGKEDYFKEKYIRKKLKNINGDFILELNYISDDKLDLLFRASDIVVLPYRKIFIGQSGPLIEGVKHNSLILSSNHGQIGYTTNQYNLGLTFESENVKDLTKKLNYILKNYRKLKRNISLKKYNEKISLNNFQNKIKDEIKKVM